MAGRRQCIKIKSSGRKAQAKSRRGFQRGEGLRGIPTEGKSSRGAVGVDGAAVAVASLHREGERSDAKRARIEVRLRRRILQATG